MTLVQRRTGEDMPPEGLLEFHAQTAIRDLIRLYGFEAAREMIANILHDEADRKPRQ